MVGSTSHACYRIRAILLGSIFNIHCKPLGFDLLLEIDAIKILGGITTELTELLQFGIGKVPTCEAISISKPSTSEDEYRLKHGNSQTTRHLKNCTMECRST